MLLLAWYGVFFSGGAVVGLVSSGMLSYRGVYMVYVAYVFMGVLFVWVSVMWCIICGCVC